MAVDVFKAIQERLGAQKITEGKAEITERFPQKDLEAEVFERIKKKFNLPEYAKLRQTTSRDDTPLEILNYDNQSFSVWYRLPARGLSKTAHIFDYAIFRGTHRITAKENPDIIIECRHMPDAKSNRLDPRVVKDLIGLCIETTPGLCILAANRNLSPHAMELANVYGIHVVDMSNENAGNELFELITSDRQVTREKLKHSLDRAIGKIEALYVRREKTPWKKSPDEIAKEHLKDKIVKQMINGPKSPAELAKIMRIHEDHILNILHVFEKEGKAKITERSFESQNKNMWALTGKAAQSSR